MDERTIEELFKKVSSHFDIIPNEAKPFFEMFIEETLAYRDELVANDEPPLTVKEVQECLNNLEEVLVTKLVKPDLPLRINSLLKRWITRLNESN